MEKLTTSSGPRFYPQFTVAKIQNPNRFYAIPLLGGFVKCVVLLPIIIVLAILGLVSFLLLIVNSFSVLFSGTYMQSVYDFIVGVMKLNIKFTLYFYGLTDTYPGFSFDTNDSFTLTVTKPTAPNRLFAVPVLGILIRAVLMIPYFVWHSILQTGAFLGAVGSSFPVLANGRYPESTYEFIRDYTRVSQAMTVYMSGLSDTYPSFWISMNHKNIKLLLIILGTIFFIFSNISKQHHPMQPGEPGSYQHKDLSVPGYQR